MSNETALAATSRKIEALTIADFPDESTIGERLKVTSHVAKVIRNQLDEGRDWGDMPGAKSKILKKAGAVKLVRAFGLRFAPTEIIESYAGDKGSRYHVRVTILNQRDAEVGSADGICSTAEKGKQNWPENNVFAVAVKRAKVEATRGAFCLDGIFDGDGIADDIARDASNDEIAAIVAGAVSSDDVIDVKTMREHFKVKTQDVSLNTEQKGVIRLAMDGLALLYASKLPEASDWPEGKLKQWGKLCDKIDDLKGFENDVREELTAP